MIFLQPSPPDRSQCLTRRPAERSAAGFGQREFLALKFREFCGLQEYRPGEGFDRADYLIPSLRFFFNLIKVAVAQQPDDPIHWSRRWMGSLIAHQDLAFVNQSQPSKQVLMHGAFGIAADKRYPANSLSDSLFDAREWVPILPLRRLKSIIHFSSSFLKLIIFSGARFNFQKRYARK